MARIREVREERQHLRGDQWDFDEHGWTTLDGVVRRHFPCGQRELTELLDHLSYSPEYPDRYGRYGVQRAFQYFKEDAWGVLIDASICTHHQAETLPLPAIPDDFRNLEPDVANAYELLLLMNNFREMIRKSVEPFLAEIGMAVITKSREIYDAKFPKSPAHLASRAEPTINSARNYAFKLILKLIGGAVGIGESAQRLAIFEAEEEAVARRAQLSALPRATVAASKKRMKMAAPSIIDRARKMRRLMATSEMTRSSAAAYLHRKYPQISKSAFYRSVGHPSSQKRPPKKFFTPPNGDEKRLV